MYATVNAGKTTIPSITADHANTRHEPSISQARRVIPFTSCHSTRWLKGIRIVDYENPQYIG